MLPVIGYSLPPHAIEGVSDPAVEAVDVHLETVSDVERVVAVTGRYPLGVVNLHLGSLSLHDNLEQWCADRQAIQNLVATGWGTTVSLSLTVQSAESGDEESLNRVVRVLRSVERHFGASRLYVEIQPAIKDPATPQRDADFLAAVLAQSGCGWLLNVAELHARSRNVGFDAYDQIAEVLPAASNVLIRVSSVRFEKRIGAVVTAAEGAIPDEVWSLLRHALMLGSHKTRAVVIAGRELRGGAILRQSDLRHTRFIIDRVQGRQRMLRQHPGVHDFLVRGVHRRA